MDKIAVLIPCYNEGQTIAKVVKDYREALPEATIYVYDNNSSDHTDEIAREAGAVVRYEYQQGKGNVIRSMFRDIDAECYVMTDGDDTYPAEDARKLADQILQGKADMVIGVPDSALAAAMGYAQQSGIPYGDGLAKNRYVGRTFIQPEQGMRELSVRTKLNALTRNVRGKRLILVDDSIVRGTTCARIVHLLREAGATEVHVRLSAPPFTDPCFFGTDVDSKENLIAAHHSVEEIGKIIGADSIGFLSLEACDKLAADSHCGFCKGCFCGKYPVDPPLVTEKNKFDQPIHGGKVQDDD